VAGKIVDQHNHRGKDNLQLERKLGTHDWSQHVNFSILGMHTINSWCDWKELSLCEVGTWLKNDRQWVCFYSCHHRNREASIVASSDAIVGHDGLPKCGVGVYLTPKKRKKEEWGFDEALDTNQM
jgi:hypothetical protein